jgi:signal transduction histidine kinase
MPATILRGATCERIRGVFHIHCGERADGLVTALGAVLHSPLDDPMQAEIVAVPTRGVERWLTQRLSGALGTSPGRADGVCANVEFPFPGRLVNGAVATAAGVDREADPWLPERSVWPLLQVVESSIAESWLAPLAAHLGGTGADVDPSRGARRLSSVRHIADLYDRYSVHRPAMLRAWAEGSGEGWQAELWRRLRERIGEPSPAERLADACVRLRAEPGLVDLPARMSLFGLTRLPASYLDVLHALAAERDVHLFLLHPSAAREVTNVSEALAGMGIALRRAAVQEETVERERRLLIGALAHDLRTPLFALRGYLQALERGMDGRDDYIARAEAKATRLERLIGDLFAFTRLEYLDEQPEFRPIWLGELLRQSASAYEPLANRNRISLEVEGSDAVRVLADSHHLERVVANLLDNAFSHTPAGGVISVRWGRDASVAWFTIADNGDGIPDSALPHLFEPLFRAKRSGNSAAEGARLGLTIAQRLLHANGGRLRAANDPAGGAVFTATLRALVQSGAGVPTAV